MKEQNSNKAIKENTNTAAAFFFFRKKKNQHQFAIFSNCADQKLVLAPDEGSKNNIH